jgi:F420H(2)-dependent quinone reductase
VAVSDSRFDGLRWCPATASTDGRDSLYLRTNGRIGHRMPGMPPFLMLHTTGAKTGALRSTALTYARDGQDFSVVASTGGAPTSPGWYHNRRNKPQVEINVGTRRIADIAHPVPRPTGSAPLDPSPW